MSKEAKMEDSNKTQSENKTFLETSTRGAVYFVSFVYSMFSLLALAFENFANKFENWHESTQNLLWGIAIFALIPSLGLIISSFIRKRSNREKFVRLALFFGLLFSIYQMNYIFDKDIILVKEPNEDTIIKDNDFEDAFDAISDELFINNDQKAKIKWATYRKQLNRIKYIKGTCNGLKSDKKSYTLCRTKLKEDFCDLCRRAKITDKVTVCKMRN